MAARIGRLQEARTNFARPTPTPLSNADVVDRSIARLVGHQKVDDVRCVRNGTENARSWARKMKAFEEK